MHCLVNTLQAVATASGAAEAAVVAQLSTLHLLLPDMVPLLHGIKRCSECWRQVAHHIMDSAHAPQQKRLEEWEIQAMALVTRAMR